MSGIPSEEALCEGLTPRDTWRPCSLVRERNWIVKERNCHPQNGRIWSLWGVFIAFVNVCPGRSYLITHGPTYHSSGPVTLKRLMIPAEIGEQSLESKHLL